VSELAKLQPQPLWDFFAKICSIPHPSYHEEALASYIVDWAKAQQLWVERDKVGNILIRKAATKGFEQLAPVALQAHLDMVAQKNNDTNHDFLTDPIKPYIEGEWLKATGTTLGADNGIGLASCLAVLADAAISHGPLEVLLTMTEESGMEGAFGLQPDWLQAKVLINTDSEEEGEIYMGCAGGIDFTFTLPLEREAAPDDFIAVDLEIKGLRGGHSGVDIHLGLGNAAKMMARVLGELTKSIDLRLCQFIGGNLRNAIPREARAQLLIAATQVEKLHQVINSLNLRLQQELGAKDKHFNLTANQATETEQPLSAASSNLLINLLNAMPNGVIRNSDVIKGVVETSLNIGIVNISASSAEINCLIRSLIDSGKEYVVGMLSSLGELAGARTKASGSYPGWKPDPNSAILAKTREIYQQLFNKEPNIQVIHAGLECGLFKKPYPELDMVSIGPTITGPHSPDERVHIASVALYWQLLTQLLISLPKQN
jgi:dipeptidase D